MKPKIIRTPYKIKQQCHYLNALNVEKSLEEMFVPIEVIPLMKVP